MRALLLAVLVSLAGCSAVGPGTPSPATSTADCTDHTESTVNPDRTGVAPKPIPDRPANLNESTVREYVVAYEEAYTYNRILSADTKRASVVTDDVSVQSSGDRFVVRLSMHWTASEQAVVEGNETATVVIADSPEYAVAYRLTDRQLTRAENGDYQKTPTVDGGETVECF